MYIYTDFESIPAKTTMKDAEVFEVLTEDPENDPVNITLLDCDCPDCPFEFLPGCEFIKIIRFVSDHEKKGPYRHAV